MHEVKRSETLEEIVALLDASSNGPGEFVALKKSVSEEIKRFSPDMKNLRVFDWLITSEDLLIEGEIGTGTFGTVRRSMWIQDGGSNRVIVKELFSKVSRKVDESFAEQLSTWKTISEHPNILKLHGGNHLGSRLFYVCEDTQGGDLVDFLSVKTNRPAFWSMFLQVAEALKFLHTRNIVHGGLRCSNIRIHNSPPTVKLTDFGFYSARLWSTSLVTEGKEAQDCAMRWQPKEVLEGTPIDDSFKSDVYSLGMCIIEAFTGEYPFLSCSSGIDEVVEMIVRGKGHTCPDEMPPAEWDLVTRMCAPQYKARPSIDEVINAIQGLMGEEEKVVIGEHEEHKTEDGEPDLTEEKPPAEEVAPTEPTESPGKFRLITPNQLPTLLERCTGRFVIFRTVISRMMNLAHLESFRQADSGVLRKLELELIVMVDDIATSKYGTFTASSSATNQRPNFDAEKLTIADLRAAVELGVLKVPHQSRYVFETHERLSDVVNTFLSESIPISDWRSLWEEDCREQVRYFSDVLERELDQSATAKQRLSASSLLEKLGHWLHNRASLTQEELALMEKARDVVRGTFNVNTGNQTSTAAEFSRLVSDSDLPKIHLKDLKVVVRREPGYLCGRWLNTPVAIKKVSGDVHQLSEAAKRWFSLRHPYIVSLLGVCTERSADILFVMEDHERGGLSSYPCNGFWGSVQAIALALQFLHDQSIAHGNVNRENICMIGRTAKLRGIESITPIGEIVDASASSSPPQSQNGLSFAADVQAFGRCILEAITGSSNEEMLSQLRESRFPSLPSEPTDEQWNLVLRMCSLDAEERITIQEVATKAETFAVDDVRKGRDTSTPLKEPALAKALTPRDCARHLRYLRRTNPSPKVLAGAGGGHDPDGGGDSSDESSDEDNNADGEDNDTDHGIDTDHSSTEDGGNQERMDEHEDPNSEDGSDGNKNCKPENEKPEASEIKDKAENVTSETTGGESNLDGDAAGDENAEDGDEDDTEDQNADDDDEDDTTDLNVIQFSELSFDNPSWINDRSVSWCHGRWNEACVRVEKLQRDELQMTKRATNESAKRWISLRHPNVHKCFGVSRYRHESHHDYTTFLVCEMPEDDSLKYFLQSHESEVWLKMLDIALAFQYLHSRSVVQGDLDWNHLIVGGNSKAWLTGLTMSSGQATPVRSRWTAPECLRDENPSFTFTSDVYSLGRCIADAVSGYFPHEDDELGDDFFYQPDRFTRVEWELVSSMCEVDPNQRVSMPEVVERLDRIVALYGAMKDYNWRSIDVLKTKLRDIEDVVDVDYAIQSMLLHEITRMEEAEESEYWDERDSTSYGDDEGESSGDLRRITVFESLVDIAISQLDRYTMNELHGVYLQVRTPARDNEGLHRPWQRQPNSDDPAPDHEHSIWHIPEEDVCRIRQVGAGGFGIVYKGWWNRTHVAIKVAERSKWSMREVDLWYPLSHPHIISLFGACAGDKKLFFVCSFAKNGDASEFLKRARKAGDRATIWQFFYEVALGLKYLHGQGIIHADLKYDNILVDATDSAMVSDFGLSFKVDERDELPPRSGAIAWVAPELMDPDKRIERLKKIESKSDVSKSDVYSLGVCIIDALTGNPPPQRHHKAIRCEKKHPPMTPGIFNGFEQDLVEHMCQYDPADRYSIDEVIKWLPIVRRNSMVTAF